MSDPVTPTDASDADIPAPEERPEDETAVGAWMDERPAEPVDEPPPDADA